MSDSGKRPSPPRSLWTQSEVAASLAFYLSIALFVSASVPTFWPWTRSAFVALHLLAFALGFVGLVCGLNCRSTRAVSKAVLALVICSTFFFWTLRAGAAARRVSPASTEADKGAGMILDDRPRERSAAGIHPPKFMTGRSAAMMSGW